MDKTAGLGAAMAASAQDRKVSELEKKIALLEWRLDVQEKTITDLIRNLSTRPQF